MAAALFRARLRQVRPDWQEWQVDSAGTWGIDGEAASKNSCVVMAERGLDIEGHRSRIVNAEMLERYTLILTMEPGHKEALQVEFPSLANRVFLLSEMDGHIASISDPYGGPLKLYQDAAVKIDLMIERGMARILSFFD
jgi:protein-tyrosine-phosphatase